MPQTRTPLTQITRQSEKSCLRILAILILIERPGRIKLFMDSGVCDADLPLVKHSSEEQMDLRRASAPEISLDCFRKWSRSTIDRFEQWQWALLAPSFDRPETKNVPHHSFDKAKILPFRFLDNQPDREGGFGTVRKVEIHPNHHRFTNDKRNERNSKDYRLRSPDFSQKETVDRRKRVQPHTYSPPEAALETYLLSPSYDIWSLGCIYLEFIAWWHGSWSSVLEFGDLRLQADQTSSVWQGVGFKSDIFFTLLDVEGEETREAVVKTSVTKFIDKLKVEQKQNRLICDFLDLIKMKMLVVGGSAENSASMGRTSSKRIGEFIEEMRKKEPP
ncbi:protein kinase [Colletotrichum graminicola]|nr:protein kinase [Colletotrichum graminicola]